MLLAFKYNENTYNFWCNPCENILSHGPCCKPKDKNELNTPTNDTQIALDILPSPTDPNDLEKVQSNTQSN